MSESQPPMHFPHPPVHFIVLYFWTLAILLLCLKALWRISRALLKFHKALQ